MWFFLALLLIQPEEMLVALTVLFLYWKWEQKRLTSCLHFIHINIERRRDKVELLFHDLTGAYQMIKEYILHKVLSTGVYVTAAWAWSIAHHSTSFGTVNLPSDWAEIGGQQWQSSQWGQFRRHFTQSAHIQRGVWMPNSHFHAE